MAVRTLINRLEHARALDGIADALKSGVDAVLRGRLRDTLHGVWLGHALHPALVQLPAGAWMSAAVLDAVPGAESAATILVAVGTASAAPAVVTGLNDWSSLTAEQRRVGLIHAGANTIALTLYAASLAARLTGNRRLGRRLAYTGLTAASVGAYLGGHLSFRQAAAVSHAAPLLQQIPAGWHDVGEFAGLTEGKPVVVHLGDVPVLVHRNGDSVTAMIEWCGHQTGPLGEGDVTRVDGVACVVCPWHGSTFRLTDGTVVRGPAASDQPLLRTEVAGGRVRISLP